MKGRTPSAEEKRFIERVCELGCIVCRIRHDVHSPASPHHMEGRVKPGAHFKVIPLCGRHHQASDTEKPPRWISRHGDGRAAFELEYGTEMDLYHTCLDLLDDE